MSVYLFHGYWEKNGNGEEKYSECTCPGFSDSCLVKGLLFEGKNMESDCTKVWHCSNLVSLFFRVGQVQKQYQILCSDREMGRSVQLLYSHSDHHSHDPPPVCQWDGGAALHPFGLSVRMLFSEVYRLNVSKKPSSVISSFMMKELYSASLIFSL